MTTRKTRVSITNVGLPAPRWFKRLSKAVSILSNTAVVIMLALGYAEDSLIMLIVRVGISGLMSFIEALLVDSNE